jgi:hypothetical protein
MILACLLLFLAGTTFGIAIAAVLGARRHWEEVCEAYWQGRFEQSRDERRRRDNERRRRDNERWRHGVEMRCEWVGGN